MESALQHASRYYTKTIPSIAYDGARRRPKMQDNGARQVIDKGFNGARLW